LCLYDRIAARGTITPDILFSAKGAPMRLSRRERRALRRIARQLRREDPDLAAQLTAKEAARRPDFDAARRRRREDVRNYGRSGRRKF
jgi:Protein of unknown function (DUF3040)